MRVSTVGIKVDTYNDFHAHPRQEIFYINKNTKVDRQF